MQKQENKEAEVEATVEEGEEAQRKSRGRSERCRG